MARKTKAEAESTRNLLLDTAEKIFFERGVSGTSLEQIARAAGMTRGAVYWHFDNKISLLEALVVRVRLPLEQMYEQLNAYQDHDPIEGLKAIIHRVLKRCDEPHIMRVYTILVYRCEFFDQLSRRCQERAYVDDIKAMIDQQLIIARDKGQLAPNVDPVVMGDILHFSIMGLIKEWLGRPDRFNISERGITMIDQLFAQFRAQGAKSH
ncbi:HTH-type transcriptional repressor BepR [Halomonadaceae bacterium LMG 33818]|uniref:TetR family transcriptional regulator n=1 Tax=Cernens ardua TaxID=3402176 RepID=UPI003EDB7851